MRHTSKPRPNRTTTPLGSIGRDPARLLTVREWWYEMEEAFELLTDPQAAFLADERELIKLCADNGIAYRPAGSDWPAAFPAWLFLRACPSNP